MDPRTVKADALLGTLGEHKGGRLKVFLGAAPGVGKTYAMLSAARELKKDGADVVVGLVETHGRRETEALLESLDILPRRSLAYRDHAIQELDFDALIKRRPQVALVDELAHSNAPGSRHERRYQDVLDLLDAGIDVYTTLNIQHLESLNDVVRQLTGVRVRETVPDQVLDRARDIVLIDLPPRELIDRLQQGKVYVPEMASNALQSFFSPSNLTALRELAVQAMADRIDADLREQLAARGAGSVPIRRRVVVAIDGLENSEYLVRVTRRLAERRQAPWTVLTVETEQMGKEHLQVVEQAFAMARRLGAETVTLRGANVVDEILDYAQRHAVSTIVIGRTRERPLARMFNRTVSQQLLQRGAHFELTIINTPTVRARSRRQANQRWEWRDTSEFGMAASVALLAAACGLLAERLLDLADQSMIFIVAVLIVATRARMAAAVFAAILCFLAYNFFFFEPRYTFHLEARQGVVSVTLFLVAALISGRLTSRLRNQVLGLRAANQHTTAVQKLGRLLSGAADEAEVVRVSLRLMAASLGAEVCVLGVDASIQGLRPLGAEPSAVALQPIDRAAADWASSHALPAGAKTDTLQASPWWFLPLMSGESSLGVVGFRFADGERPAERAALALAMVQDVADALARTRLVQTLETTRVQNETERLRAALLASVSHDLRSPLSSMIGSAESLLAYGDRMSDGDRRDLLEAIHEEGQRLDRYIQNLLDMTRLGHGTLKLHRDWVSLDEILGSAVSRLRKSFPACRVEVNLAADIPLLYAHPALIEQALFNILENAAKFSPPGVAVEVVAAMARDGQLQIDITDRGPGIPEDERRRIFDMFYSVERGDRGRNGTGMGLNICEGMIGAHGGTVEALAGYDGIGTVIRVHIPMIDAPAASDEG